MIEKLSAYATISFDLFDTLIIRRYADPKDVFRELEKNLQAAGSRSQGFAESRVQAELSARKKHNFRREVTLESIYEEVQRQLLWSQEETEKVRQLELVLEKQALVANPSALQLLNNLRDRNKKILFISDIYLPEPFIREVLMTLQVLKPQDRLYVSSSLGIMKAHGELFHHVLKDNDLTPHQLCHVGDNPDSDVKMPRQLGIHALHYTETFPGRYEKSAQTELMYSKLSAAAKITRLQNPEHLPRQQSIWNVSAGVSAPMMFAFVNWCINRAVEQNISTLYFLSRDGQVLYKIAEQIVTRHYPGKISLQYLYVSRQALLFPAIEAINKEALQWIMAPTSLLTPRIILKRLNFTPEEFAEHLSGFGFTNKLDKHLDQPERGRFREMLMAAEQDIMQRVASYRENALCYFKQQGLLGEDLFAVIDIGWSGTLQRSISRMLCQTGDQKPLFGFYFGLKARNKYKETDEMYAWFSDFKAPRDLDRKTYIIPMTELFTAADHGGVVKYDMEQDKAVPVFKQETNVTGLEWGVVVQQQAMLCFTANALQTFTISELALLSGSDVAFFEQIYEQFLRHPQPQEAAAYAQYQDAEDQNESYHKPLAQPYRLHELFQVKTHQYKHHHNEWQEGALAISNPWLVRLIYGKPKKHTPEPS